MSNFNLRYINLRERIMSTIRDYGRPRINLVSSRKMNKKVLHDFSNEYANLLRDASNPAEKAKAKQIFRLIRRVQAIWHNQSR
jgi:hypothetical protein